MINSALDNINPRNRLLLGVLTASLAILVGTATVQLGMTFLYVLAILVAAGVIFAFPRVGLYMLIATIPFEAFILIGDVSLSRIIGIVTFLAWGIHKLARRDSLVALFRGRLTPFLLLYFLLALASTLWARYQSEMFTSLGTLAQLIAFYLLVVDQIDSWQALRRTCFVLLPTVLAATVVGLYQFYVLHFPRAGEDVIGSENEYAALIVLTIPLLIHFISNNSTPRAIRLLATLMAPVALLGIGASFSRTAYITLPIVVLLQLHSSTRSKRSVLALVVMLAAGLIAYRFLPWDAVVIRSSTIIDAAGVYESGPPTSDALSERDFIWRVALTIFLLNPVLGVGYYNFGRYYTYQYQYLVPGASAIATVPRSPHSLYLGVLADLGLVGFILLLTILGQVFSMWRDARKALESNRELHAFAATLRNCLIAYLIYSFAAFTEGSKLLWLLFALTQVVYNLALVASKAESQHKSLRKVTHKVTRKATREATYANG